MNKLGNTSSAVMQQRRSGQAALDDFPTPPWATRAFCHHVLQPWAENAGTSLEDLKAWEPACNRGFMARPLAEYFGSVFSTDVHHYGWDGQDAWGDFLLPFGAPDPLDWIITNPPFRLAAQFAQRCAALHPLCGYALLTRIAFLEGVERYETVFRDNPPNIVAQYAERVPMVEGRYDPEASTATAYCWLVWLRKSWGPSRIQWIPPCRKHMQRHGDADAA